MASLLDIEKAITCHCLRRARALCKIYAGEHTDGIADAHVAYEHLKKHYGLEGLDMKKKRCSSYSESVLPTGCHYLSCRKEASNEQTEDMAY